MQLPKRGGGQAGRANDHLLKAFHKAYGQYGSSNVCIPFVAGKEEWSVARMQAAERLAAVPRSGGRRGGIGSWTPAGRHIYSAITTNPSQRTTAAWSWTPSRTLASSGT